MTTAATRHRSTLASIYGDTRKAARLREQADTLDRLQAAGDEGERLMHESVLLNAKLRKKIIAAAIRADRYSR